MVLSVRAKWWYKRFRAAAYVNAIVWSVWTVAIILPLAPFSYLQPIMVGGGPGMWFVLAYLLFVVGVVAFAVVSSLTFVIEVHEKRILNGKIMIPGFALSWGGMMVACILLAAAGASGGYTLVIQHSTISATHSILSQYVDPISIASLAAVAGAVLITCAMVTAKASKS